MKQCPIAHSLVHYYFRDKNALARALLELNTKHLQVFVNRRVKKEKSSQDHFKVYCEATLERANEHRSVAAVLLAFLNFGAA